MEAKFVLFGKSHSGKTQTLKSLIYLLSKSVSGPCVINGTYHASFAINLLNFAHELRVSFIYRTSTGVSCGVAICTQGDDDMIVRENWDFFLERGIYAKCFRHDVSHVLRNTICISPCRPSGSSCQQEEFEQHMHASEDMRLWQRIKNIENAISNNELSEFEGMGIFNTRGNMGSSSSQRKNSIALAYRLKKQIDDIINKQYFIL